MPGILGPTIEEVYFIISVSGGRRTPPRIELGSLKLMKKCIYLQVYLLLI